MGSLAASVGNIGSPEDPYAPPFGKAAKRGAFSARGGRSLPPGRPPFFARGRPLASALRGCLRSSLRGCVRSSDYPNAPR